jgi:cell division protein FtsN
MKKTIRLIIALSIVLIATSACKTKQKVAAIPGANIPATAAVVEKPAVTQPATKVVNENEVTRNENFSLADGESNSDALKFKYHVVVGSFGKQTNAKGLQSTLNSEGNRAVVVVNEKGMFRVLIASFNEYAQARTRINQIKNRFPDAWVLVQK